MIDTITPYLPYAACIFFGFLVGFCVFAVVAVNKGDYDDGFADGVRFRQFGDEA